jgi:hypothetical protein
MLVERESCYPAHGKGSYLPLLIPHPKPNTGWASQLQSRRVRFGGTRADTVGVMSFLPLSELPALFPHVVDWISYLERQAHESGRALTPIEFKSGAEYLNAPFELEAEAKAVEACRDPSAGN